MCACVSMRLSVQLFLIKAISLSYNLIWPVTSAVLSQEHISSSGFHSCSLWSILLYIVFTFTFITCVRPRSHCKPLCWNLIYSSDLILEIWPFTIFPNVAIMCPASNSDTSRDSVVWVALTFSGQQASSLESGSTIWGNSTQCSRWDRGRQVTGLLLGCSPELSDLNVSEITTTTIEEYNNFGNIYFISLKTS